MLLGSGGCDERVADGSVVVLTRGNARRAKGPCCRHGVVKRPRQERLIMPLGSLQEVATSPLPAGEGCVAWSWWRWTWSSSGGCAAGRITSDAKSAGKRSAGRSSQQGCNPAGGSPAMSIAHFRHVAIPHPGTGNRPGDAWCKRPGCSASRRCCGGCNLGVFLACVGA